jgi:hypothetical protein
MMLLLWAVASGAAGGCARGRTGRPRRSFFIVSYVTICKGTRNMRKHLPLELERFLPYRLSILSN